MVNDYDDAAWNRLHNKIPNPIRFYSGQNTQLLSVIAGLTKYILMEKDTINKVWYIVIWVTH